jgi:hypothetical protein
VMSQQPLRHTRCRLRLRWLGEHIDISQIFHSAK